MSDIEQYICVKDMERLLGQWKLKENIRFTKFLSFTQLPWYQIHIANHSHIDLHLHKISDMKYSKKVSSMFYNVEHTININNTFTTHNDGKQIKYNLLDHKIITDIIGTIVNWQEIISFEDPHLKIDYVWEENGERKTASQTFEKQTHEYEESL